MYRSSWISAANRAALVASLALSGCGTPAVVAPTYFAGSEATVEEPDALAPAVGEVENGATEFSLTAPGGPIAGAALEDEPGNAYSIQDAGCGWAAPWDNLAVKAQKQACWADVHGMAVGDFSRQAWDLVRSSNATRYTVGFPISKVKGVSTLINKANKEATEASKNARNASSYWTQANRAASRERNASKKARLQAIANEASSYASSARSAADSATAAAAALKRATVPAR